MLQALLDTNIIIGHILGRLNLEFLPKTMAVSSLTIFEAMHLPGISHEEELALQDFFQLCDVIPVSERIGLHAAMIGRTVNTKPVDLLIAATALEFSLPLITLNTKDFKGIANLSLRTMI